MTSRKVTVTVASLTARGKTATRTLWWTRYGPMFDILVGVPLPWTHGDRVRDDATPTPTTSASSTTSSPPTRRSRRSEVLDDPQAATRASRGSTRSWPTARATRSTPTSARSRTSRTRRRRSATPRSARRPSSLLGLPVLDGSRTSCDWQNDPDAVRARASSARATCRTCSARDYVTNSNDSYWLSNPQQPLEGFARIIGDERTARSLRTRIGLIMTQAGSTAATTSGRRLHPPGHAEDRVPRPRSTAASWPATTLVAMCRALTAATRRPRPGRSPVGNACDVLAGWDLHENLDSAARCSSAASGRTPRARRAVARGRRRSTRNDPVNTPNDAQHAATRTVQTRARRRDHRPARRAASRSTRRSASVAVRHAAASGSRSTAAPATRTATSTRSRDRGSPGKGFTRRAGTARRTCRSSPGTSAACPDARTILTYSQSTEPDTRPSPDQTKLFSQKKWVPACSAGGPSSGTPSAPPPSGRMCAPAR